MVEPRSRPVGDTERSWCRAVRSGTGVAVLALRTSSPPDIPRLQAALHELQSSHPILRSRLHSNAAATSFSFLTSPAPSIKIRSETLPSSSAADPLRHVLELELNRTDAWRHPASDDDLLLATLYGVHGGASTRVLSLTLHVSACDRTTALLLLRELLALMAGGGGAVDNNINNEHREEASLAMEDLVPPDKAKKPIWTRGLDMLAYSLTSLRLTTLKFIDTKHPRLSHVLRLQLNQNHTTQLLAGCKWSGIKLCGALVAAGLMAAHCSKRSSRKYGVVTFTDCRSSLEPPLSDNFGFYHSAILNTHEVKGGESMWELAKRTYEAFAKSKRCNKHLSDMADLSFLMCKAIENPGLTPSSSLRTSVMAVFEDTVVDNGGSLQRQVGVEDYVGCASVHGVGPSIGIFDTVRDGSLDCVCVYPAPLHSRQQVQEILDNMKAILIQGANTYKE
ncbi:hypothetical protein Fmac_027443 [Flemingia macrophylla]|uniref:Uncharacterized protein n=1 Tax=Flemingia macrophylla TaxID=520843 RepID=A0ABD1LHT1_9FABA